MRFYTNRQFEMVRLTADLLKRNKEKLVKNVPALAELIDDLVDSEKQIEKLISSTSGRTKISTYQKSGGKEMLIDAVLKLSGAVKAYAYKKKDTELVKKVSVSKSQLTRPKPVEIAERCKDIIEAAKNIKAIEQYGVTPEEIQLADSYRAQFVNLMDAPKKKREQVKEESSELDKLVKECVFSLKEQIDALVKIACKSNPQLLSNYRGVRKVLKEGPGRKEEKEVRYRDSRTKANKKRKRRK